ncbi:hypothetical protein Emag_001261 [Eimeria magna]
MEPRVLLLVLIAVLAALAATQRSAAQGHKLLQVASSLQTSELKARVSSWRSSSKSDELHSFALLHLKALMGHQGHQEKQEENEDRRLVCSVLSQALERWQQQHKHVLQAQKENQQREQQQDQKKEQLQHEQIRELIQLLEAAAAAECSALLRPQLQGDLRVTIAQSLQALAMPASGEEATVAALWAAAAAAGAAASVSPAANASLLVSSQVPSAFPSTLEHRRSVVAAIDILTKEINAILTHSQPLPPFLGLRLEALLLAAEAGTFIAEIKAGEKTLKLCDLWGRELPEKYEVSLQVKREKGEKQKEENASSEVWCSTRSIGISLETPSDNQTENHMSLQPGLRHELPVEAPAVIRLKIKMMPRAARGLAQAAVLATLREAEGPLPASVPRFTQWSLRVGMHDYFLLDLKIGDPEMLLPVSGLYDFELLLAQKNPLRTCRRLLFSANLIFPFPLKQIVVTAPDHERLKQYAILPAEQALHPLATLEYTFEPPPIKASLCYVWFSRLGANVKLLRWQVEDASFVGCLILAVSLLAYFFVYRDFWFLLKMLAAASVPMVLLTHRAFVAVRIRRREMGEEEEIDKAAFVRK